jgi:ABC-type multidrug transport system ATPase subunit
MQLVITNLSKTYPGGVRALDNVSMTIPTGMFGLLGPNGAGKSTLMRTLATLQTADSGSAMLGTLDVLNNKKEVRVQWNNKTVRAMIYYMPPGFDLDMPSESYLNTVTEGYSQHSMDILQIVNALEDLTVCKSY